MVNTCQRCGYEWEPRKANPKECPNCKSYGWRTPAKLVSTRRRHKPSLSTTAPKR